MKSTLHTRITKGSRVMFAREWLRNTGQFTGDVPFMEGTVTALGPRVWRFAGDTEGPSLITVKWDGERTARKVLSFNLVRKEDRHLESA